jgi:hypothetical protein
MADAEYRDDPTIPDEAELWRRIPHWHVHFDVRLNRLRPASAAFDDDPDSDMSVVLADETPGPDAVLAGHQGFALAAITAGLARACGLGVVRDPLPDNPAHAVVFGPKTNAVIRRLARQATWVIAPAEQ